MTAGESGRARHSSAHRAHRRTNHRAGRLVAHRNRNRRPARATARTLGLIVALVAGLVAVLPQTTPLRAQAAAEGAAAPAFEYQRASVRAADGEVQPATAPAVSADGRYIAWVSNMNADSFDEPTILWRDTHTGTTKELAELYRNGDGAMRPVISDDGKFVAFASSSTDLPRPSGCDSDCYFAYVVDTGTGQLVRVGDQALQIDRWTGMPLDISGDGSRLAYFARDDADEQGLHPHLIVADWSAGSVRDQGAVYTEEVQGFALSADGSTLAYGAVEWDEPSDEYSYSVAVRDLSAGTQVATISRGPAGDWTDAERITDDAISIDRTGQHIAYVAFSDHDNLDTHLAVWDRTAPDDAPTVINAVGPDPDDPEDMDATRPQLAGDASRIAFEARGGYEGYYIETAALDGSDAVLVSASPDGDPQRAKDPRISADGTVIAFVSERYFGDDTLDDWNDSVYLARVTGGTPSAPAAWPDGASLQVSDLADESLTLTWPKATAPTGPAHYQLSVDGEWWDSVDEHTTSYAVDGLDRGVEYHFELVPVSPWGVAGTPLKVTANTATAPEDGAARLSADADNSSTVSLTWDAASGASGYRILRAEPDEEKPFAAIADVPGGTTTFTDTGLLALTSYVYRVDRLDGSGQPHPWTVAVDVDTAGLLLSSAAVEWVTTTELNGTLELGSDLSFTLVGEPGRQTSVQLDYLMDDNPETHSATVALTESGSAPGTYTGTWRVAEHISTISAATGWMTDGVHTVPRQFPTRGEGSLPLPLPVSGALAITVEAPPAGGLSGALLFASSGTSSSYGSVQIDAPGVYVLPMRAPADDITVTLQGPNREVLATATGFAVANGRTTAASLAPTSGGTVTGTVRDGHGAALNGVAIYVTQTVDGHEATFYTTTGTDGQYSVGLLAGPATVAATLDGYHSATRDVTVPAGASVTADLVMPQHNWVTAQMVADPDWRNARFTIELRDSDGNRLAGNLVTGSGKLRLEAELTPGETYKVQAVLADVEARISRIETATFIAVEGPNELTLTAHPLPVGTVTGAVTISGTPAGDDQPVTVTQFVDSRSWTFTAYTDSNGHYSLPVLAGDVTVSTAKSGYATATVQTTAAADSTVAVDLNIRQFGALTVHVLPAAGQPAGAASVTLRDGNGSGLAFAQLSGGTDAQLNYDLEPDKTYSIDVRLTNTALPVYLQESATFTAVEGPNEVTLTQRPLPAGTITGTVTSGGAPAGAGIELRVTQTVDARTWTFNGVTDADGTYRIDTLAGDANITTLKPPVGYFAAGGNVTVPDGGEAVLDLNMSRGDDYVIHARLYTQNYGSATTLQTLDWTTNIHFHVTLRDSTSRSLPVANDVGVKLNATSVTLCADGREAGLPAGCATAELGDDYEVTVALHLVQAGVVTAHLLAADGSDHTGHWQLTATPVDAEGKKTGTAVSTDGYGSDLRAGIPEKGRYQIQVSGGSLLPARIVDLPDGGELNLGTLGFSTDRTFDPAASTVVATKQTVVPGDLVEIRASYLASTSAPNAVARLAIPVGTTLLPESVLVDDQPVDGAIVDGYFEAPLGSLATKQASVVRYTLAVDADAPGGDLSADVWIRHSGTREQSLGSATAQIVGLQLAAPQHTSTATFAVTGRAPAGSLVSVLADSAEVAGATAGPGGLWSADVSLDPAVDGRSYRLTATTISGDRQFVSNAVSVVYDTDYIRPTRITVGQPDGRDHSFDPAAGTARFTLVYVPSRPIRVHAEFTDTSRLSNVVTQVGQVSAPMTCDATSCTADVQVSATQVGPVWLDYDVAPVAPASPADVPRPPAGAQLAAMLPGPFAGMSATGATSNGDGSISGSGGFAGNDMTWSATVRAGESEAFGETIDYGGMPVSFSHSESASDSEFTATVKVGVPSEWADQDTANAFLANALTSGKLYEAALHPSSFGATTLASPAGMKKFIEVSYQVYSGADNASSLISEAFKGPEEALNRLVDLPYEIEKSCLSDTEKTLLKLQVNAAALEISFMSAAAQVIPAAVFVLGFFVPVPGLNIVADFALGKFLSFASDKLNLLNAQLTAGNVESALEHAKCPEPPKPPKKPPTGDPTYIFDPSGFTYEALPGERLAGVTATIQTAAGPTGPWSDWDASAFGQDSPQVTDTEGRYGWDVPPGWWRVQFDKAGYQSAYSDALQVLPPHTDVNVGLERIAPPVPGAATVKAGAVEFGFDTWMIVGTAPSAVALLDGDGHPVAGSVAGVDPQTAPDGTVLAKGFVFTPDAQLASGGYVLRIETAALDYAHVGLASVAQLPVTVPGAGSGDDADSGTGSGADGGGSAYGPDGSNPDGSGVGSPDNGSHAGPDAAEAGNLSQTGGPFAELIRLSMLLLLCGAALLAAGHRRRSRRQRG